MQETSVAQQSAPQHDKERLLAPVFDDSLYLRTYQRPTGRSRQRGWQPAPCLNRLGTRGSRRILAAALVGICAGLAAAALQVSDRALANPAPAIEQANTAPVPRPEAAPAALSHAPAAVPAAVVNQQPPTATKQPVSQTDIVRLKARNRRLEALIYVLRQRATHQHPPAAPRKILGEPPNALLGQ